MIQLRPSFASTLALALLLVACEGSSSDVETSAAPITARQIKLPEGDPCNDVLKPLAEASVAAATWVGSLARAKRVEVKLVSETEYRDYEIFVDGPEFTVNGETFANDWTNEVTLDNDSSFMCSLIQMQPKPGR
jgi:hypothetical protein